MLDTHLAKTHKPYRKGIGGVNVFHSYNCLSEVILEMDDDDIIALENEWNTIKDENAVITAYNRNLRVEIAKKIEEFCESLDIPTYKTSKYGKVIGEYKEFKAMLKALDAKIITWEKRDKPSPHVIIVDGEEMRSSRSPVTLMGLVKQIRERIARKKAAERTVTKEQLLAASMAAQYGIDVNDPDLVQKVRAKDQERWVEENYPNGTEVDIDCCDFCDTWTVGEHRCSCGNRRMYLDVSGGIRDWWAYPAAD